MPHATMVQPGASGSSSTLMEGSTHIATVLGITALIAVADLVKIVFVELAHKAGKVAVLEMLG